MRTWAILIGGPCVWTVHFFGLYILASALPGRESARWLSALLTLLCAGGLVLLLLWIRRGSDRLLDGWARSVGTALAALLLVAVVWQGLPVLF